MTSEHKGSARRLQVIICADTEPDFPLKAPTWQQEGSPELFRCLEKGIPRLKSAVDLFVDCEGRAPRISWLLRADSQIRDYFGHSAVLYDRFEEMWTGLVRNGDAIGWHPHLYRWSQGHRQWVPALTDRDLIEGQVEIVKEIADRFPTDVARTGWDHHSNETMAQFDRLGVRLDLSGLPGQVLYNFTDSPVPWKYDWRPTTETAYYPSEKDYRRPAEPGERSLEILEAPISLTPLRTWMAIAKMSYHRLMAVRHRRHGISAGYFPYMSADSRRITEANNLVAPGTKKKAQLASEGILTRYITYFHPDEFKDAGSIDNFAENLSTLTVECERFGASFEYLTARELLDQPDIRQLSTEQKFV